MFACCFGCHNKQRDKQLTLLLIGLNNAGKTTICNTLKGDLHSDTTPSFGFTSSTIQAAPQCKLQLYDLGGGRGIRRIWNIYVAEVHGIMYIIDAADSSRFQEARDALHQLLQAPQLTGKPILVFANKQDVANAQPCTAVAQALGLAELQQQRQCSIYPCTARNSTEQQQPDPALQQGVQWLVTAIMPMYDQLQAKIEREAAEAKALEEQRRKEREERARLNRIERLQQEKEAEEQIKQQQQLEQEQQSLKKQHHAEQGTANLLIKAGRQQEEVSSSTSCLLDSSQQVLAAISPVQHMQCAADSLPQAALLADNYSATAGCMLVGSSELAGVCTASDAPAGSSSCPPPPTPPLAAAATAKTEVSEERPSSPFSTPCPPQTAAVPAAQPAASCSSASPGDSPDAAATIILHTSSQTPSAAGAGVQQGPSKFNMPWGLMGLLQASLPGATAATEFCDLKQAAHDVCGPTPRSHSITSEASSLFTEPSQLRQGTRTAAAAASRDSQRLSRATGCSSGRGGSSPDIGSSSNTTTSALAAQAAPRAAPAPAGSASASGRRVSGPAASTSSECGKGRKAAAGLAAKVHRSTSLPLPMDADGQGVGELAAAAGVTEAAARAERSPAGSALWRTMSKGKAVVSNKVQPF